MEKQTKSQLFWQHFWGTTALFWLIFGIAPLIIGIVFTLIGSNSPGFLIVGLILLALGVSMYGRVLAFIPASRRYSRQMHAIQQRMVEAVGKVTSCVPHQKKPAWQRIREGQEDGGDDWGDDDDPDEEPAGELVSIAGSYQTISHGTRKFFLKRVEIHPGEGYPDTIAVWYDPQVKDGSQVLTYTDSRGNRQAVATYDLTKEAL